MNISGEFTLHLYPLWMHGAFVVAVSDFMHILLPCEFLCFHTAGSTCTVRWIIEWRAKCPCLWHLCLPLQAFDVWDPISIQIQSKLRWQKWDFIWQIMRLKQTFSWYSCDKHTARCDKTRIMLPVSYNDFTHIVFVALYITSRHNQREVTSVNNSISSFFPQQLFFKQ